MRCPECGAPGYSRKTKTPEWRCSKCGHEWDVTTLSPENGTGKRTVPKGVWFKYSLNVILWPVIFFAVGGIVFATLSPIRILITLFLGRVFGNVFPVLIVVLAIGIGYYVAKRVYEDVSRRIDKDW